MTEHDHDPGHLGDIILEPKYGAVFEYGSESEYLEGYLNSP